MNALNALLTRLAESAFGFSRESPLGTLLLWSALVGVLMTVVFRYTSNQRVLKQVADRMRAQVLAIKLFKDDLRTVFRSLSRLLWYAVLRILYSLPPMAVMAIPFVILYSQFSLRYDHRPLAPGESTIIEMHFKSDAWDEQRPVFLEVPPELEVETSPLRDFKKNVSYWRIGAREPVRATLELKLGEESYRKQLVVTEQKDLLSMTNRRRGNAVWENYLLHPGESAFPADSPVQAVVIHYPTRSLPVFGLDVPWWLTSLIVMMLAAVLVKPMLNVHF